ncbi:MAG: hypothetical protein ABSC03_15195 [Verrucomicrobiota bacterium]|jgi:hypothetical protein
MTDLIVECRGGVVQELTVIGEPARVFVLDWDEDEDKGPGAECALWTTQRGAGSLAPETRALYEQAVRAK